MDVLDQDAARKLQHWFDARWNDTFAIDISDDLADLIETSWARESLRRQLRLGITDAALVEMVIHLYNDERLVRVTEENRRDAKFCVSTRPARTCQLTFGAPADVGVRWAHDYALQTLNRLMFLYFVQRKGRPGGNPAFIANFWQAYKASDHPPDTFFTDWLSVLFFEAFNNQFQAGRARPTNAVGISSRITSMAWT